MSGRLATKRKKSTTENKGKTKVSKAGKKIRCSICKERRPQQLNVKRQKKQKFCVKQNAEHGSRSEPQQHEEVEMTLIEMDTTQNDTKATHNDVESSSAWYFSQYMQVTPPRSYEGEEVVVGGEAEEGGNVQDDEVIPNFQVVDNVKTHEVVLIVQVQQGRVRPISKILNGIRRRKSERILKLKLGKRIGGVDDPGNSKGKALLID
uniref:Uncharacterized protein n=1 Tax=Lactuca sativa TaxID=4236 RepID=A0A9R1WCN9_LACSA|nr:hypothetical protein LSAT_V11C200071940 [Lactuca sativa]